MGDDLIGMTEELANDADRWRDRVSEMRTLAQTTNDPEARDLILEIAKLYEYLGKRAQGRDGSESTAA